MPLELIVRLIKTAGRNTNTFSIGYTTLQQDNLLLFAHALRATWQHRRKKNR
ncbi:hypothetical protein ACWD4T_18910 [Streptomyces umbrinus]